MRTTAKQRARAGLALALEAVHSAEALATGHARELAKAKAALAHKREVLRLATADARKAGVL